MPQCLILLISAWRGFLHSQPLESPTSYCRQIRLNEFSFLNEIFSFFFFWFNRPEHGLEPSDMPRLCLPAAANAVMPPSRLLKCWGSKLMSWIAAPWQESLPADWEESQVDLLWLTRTAASVCRKTWPVHPEVLLLNGDHWWPEDTKN